MRSRAGGTWARTSPPVTYTYSVCGSSHQLVHVGECYTIRVGFYAELESGGKGVWVVQAEIDAGGGAGPDNRVPLIGSDTMEITAPYAGAGDYAGSVEETVFFLDRFAGGHLPQRLAVGETWGSVVSPNPNLDAVVASRDSAQLAGGGTLDVFIVRYDLFETSVFAANRDMPFPVYAVAYDPRWQLPDPPVRFTFEPVDYRSSAAGAADAGIK